MARAHAILGEHETALDWLERAFGASAMWQRRLALWMKDDEDIDPLRGHPRFHALLERLEPVLGRTEAGSAPRVPVARAY